MCRLLAVTTAIMIGVTLLPGCKETVPEGTNRAVKLPTAPPTSADPVEALRKLVRSDRLGKHVRAAPPKQDYEVEAWIVPESVKIDVRKTDSLVSPLVGIITLEVVEFGVYEGGKKVGPKDVKYLEFRFNYVDGQWVPQEKFRLVENVPVSGPKEFFYSKTEWLIKQRPYLLKVLDECLVMW